MARLQPMSGAAPSESRPQEPEAPLRPFDLEQQRRDVRGRLEQLVRPLVWSLAWFESDLEARAGLRSDAGHIHTEGAVPARFIPKGNRARSGECPQLLFETVATVRVSRANDKPEVTAVNSVRGPRRRSGSRRLPGTPASPEPRVASSCPNMPPPPSSATTVLTKGGANQYSCISK